jgi:superfamily II DNA or RNA helicase
VFANVPIRWGLTGTIPKEEHEYAGVVSTLGSVINQLSASDLQEQGVLANLDISVLQLMDTHVGFNSYAQELKWLVTSPERIKFLSDMVGNLSGSGNTLILVDRIKTGQLLIEQNPDWVFVSGEMKSADRKTEYKEVSKMDNKVIVATYGVASTGINIPRIFNLILLEPGKSFVRVIQSIGRGIRKAQDKDYLQVFDITSTLKYSKRHLTERKKFYKEANYPFKVTKVEYL